MFCEKPRARPDPSQNPDDRFVTIGTPYTWLWCAVALGAIMFCSYRAPAIFSAPGPNLNGDRAMALLISTGPLDPDPKSIKTCAHCKGTGGRAGLRCPVCNGIGRMLVKNPPTECRACKGIFGNSAELCRACSGSGWVAATRM